MEVVLAEKYGFCAGVRVADKIVRLAAARGLSGGILGQVVHNESVEAEMARQGLLGASNSRAVMASSRSGSPM